MKDSFAPISIIRPGNAFMAGLGTALGFWLSGAKGWEVFPLALASITAVGYGNVINDIRDIEADRINRPDRVLPRGGMSVREAWIFAVLLATTAIASGLVVSPPIALATVIPLLLLTVYSWHFKGTRLIGNLLVSAMVAYPVVYGGLRGPLLYRLFAPALLAFVLNTVREIIKDVQDFEGDQSAGLSTTATLPFSVIRTLLGALGFLYLPLLFLPYILNHFEAVYLLVALVLVPVHFWWISYVIRNVWVKKAARISSLIKIELLGGLIALGADQLLARL